MIRRLTDPIGKAVLNLLADKDVESDAKRRLNHPRTDVGEVTDLFLQYFSLRTRNYVAGILFLSVLLAGLDLAVCGRVPGQSYGLLLDICGAVVLGRGLLKGPYRMAAESASYFSKSLPRQRALAQDAADGLWGIFLLISGVRLQFGAVSGLLPVFYYGCIL